MWRKSGAPAASAGTYILYASHIAAMAPGTNLGAATPIQIGGPPEFEPEPETKPKSAPRPTETPSDESGKKLLKNEKVSAKSASSAKQYKMPRRIFAHLTDRDRNAEWAELAVKKAVSRSAVDALKLKVIDYVATDVADLLKQVHGRQVPYLREDYSRYCDCRGADGPTDCARDCWLLSPIRVWHMC